MAGQINLQIVTPQKATYSATVSEVVLPGSEGDLGVLPGHIPLVTTLRPGELVARGSEVRHFAVSDGYAEILPNQVRVLVSNCEGADEIDIENARKRASDLEKAIGDHASLSPEEMHEHIEHLERERARIHVAEYATGKK